MKKSLWWASQIALASVLVFALAGCPFQPGRLLEATLYVLLTAGDNYGDKAMKAEVAVDDIESLTVTVTKVSLVPAGDVEDPEGEDPEGEESVVKAEESHQVLFEGSMEVNLLDLTDVSAVLSSAEVEPGTYEQIRLEIEDPRLVLKADPETVITDIQLTANGRLFISGEFEIAEGESQLLVLDFGGIHLVETGNGKYVLTPQLRADVTISEAAAAAVGTVTALDVDADTMTVTLADGTELAMSYAGAVVFLPTDVDTPTGTELDLALDLEVEVQGTFWVDGSMNAQSIRIYAPAVEPEPDPEPQV